MVHLLPLLSSSPSGRRLSSVPTVLPGERAEDWYSSRNFKHTFSFRCSLAADMGEGNPKKPWGNMSLYTYFMHTYREEHKKKHLDSSVNYILDFAEKVKLSAT